MICQTEVQVICLYCNKPKTLTFSQFFHGSSLCHKGCVTRYINLNRRDYSDPIFRKKTGDFHRGKIMSLESREKMSRARKGNISPKKGKSYPKIIRG